MASDGDVIITVTRGGKTFRCSRRTAAHLDYTLDRLDALDGYSRESFYIFQSSYNVGYGPSAGTHDKDAVFDNVIWGMDWWQQQRFLRECGWAAWYRYPPLFSAHIHMISLGTPHDRLGYIVPSQISDYYNHRNGLAGHAADNSWHPPNIEATVFRMGQATEQEDEMQQEDFERIRRIVHSELKDFRANSAARDAKTQEMLRVLSDHLAAVDDAVEDSTDEVKAKVNAARETTVAAFRRVAENIEQTDGK